jgi:hypothetical protein
MPEHIFILSFDANYLVLHSRQGKNFHGYTLPAYQTKSPDDLPGPVILN